MTYDAGNSGPGAKLSVYLVVETVLFKLTEQVQQLQYKIQHHQFMLYVFYCQYITTYTGKFSCFT